MSDWRSLATYNKIGFFQPGNYDQPMTFESSEIDSLNTLDPQAITAIHNRYYPEVYRFARFRVSDEIIAEDIAGDVFMQLLDAVHRGRGPVTNLRGWLIRTTANIVNNHFRDQYNRPKDDPVGILEERADLYLAQPDPVVLSDAAERKRLLLKAIDELSEAQKLVITLRFGNRFTLEETAILMGKNTNSIKAIQYRALMALRRILGSEML